MNPRIKDVLLIAPIPLIMIIASKWSAWAILFVVGFIAMLEFLAIVLPSREKFYKPSLHYGHLLFLLTMVVGIFSLKAALFLAIVNGCLVYSQENYQVRMDLCLGQILSSVLPLAAFALRNVDTSANFPFGGLSILGLALVITTFSDSAAYFIGKAIGRTKFAPVISPNKTWEGVIGGWVFGVLAAILYTKWLLPALANYHLLVLILVFWVLTFAGQMGDLCESWFKRRYGVKDSGSILRSHGGILDRFDSLAFVLPLLIFFLALGGHV